MGNSHLILPISIKHSSIIVIIVAMTTITPHRHRLRRQSSLITTIVSPSASPLSSR
jgi:hypothetical protein